MCNPLGSAFRLRVSDTCLQLIGDTSHKPPPLTLSSQTVLTSQGQRPYSHIFQLLMACEAGCRHVSVFMVITDGVDVKNVTPGPALALRN